MAVLKANRSASAALGLCLHSSEGGTGAEAGTEAGAGAAGEVELRSREDVRVGVPLAAVAVSLAFRLGLATDTLSFFTAEEEEVEAMVGVEEEDEFADEEEAVDGVGDALGREGGRRGLAVVLPPLPVGLAESMPIALRRSRVRATCISYSLFATAAAEAASSLCVFSAVTVFAWMGVSMVTLGASDIGMGEGEEGEEETESEFDGWVTGSASSASSSSSSDLSASFSFTPSSALSPPSR